MSYEEIRYAVACEVAKCQNRDGFNEDGWDTYIDETKNPKKIVMVKYVRQVSVTQDKNIDGKYKFTFDLKKIKNTYARIAFSELFQAQCDDSRNYELVFYFVYGDIHYSCFRADEICSLFQKRDDICDENAEGKYYIIIDTSGNISFRAPHAASPDTLPINSGCEFQVLTDKCKEMPKNFNDLDWKRLLDRSFEKKWKYDKKNISNECSNCMQNANKSQCKACYSENVFKEILPIEGFNAKFFKEPRQCVYCGIKEEQLQSICKQTKRAGRGERLEYDRIDDDKDYAIDNVVLACYYCNNAKSDEFSPAEFKEIARGINKVWNIRLGVFKPTENVVFPEHSNIWNYHFNYTNN
ncbi:MAG: hypothetical protein IE878_04570, partial [Epsilonproteobacteria bacterium]|nr:hypothetical protein [Campylobacterota bacterium]